MSGGDLDPKWDLTSPPTEGQRRFTIILAGFLTVTLAGLAILAIWSYMESGLPLGFPVVTSLATALCGAIFWRLLSSKPRALGQRTATVLSVSFIVIGIALLFAAGTLEQLIEDSLSAKALGFLAISCGIANLVHLRRK